MGGTSPQKGHYKAYTTVWQVMPASGVCTAAEKRVVANRNNQEVKEFCI